MPGADVAPDSLPKAVTPSGTIVLVIAENPRRNGKYSAWCDGELILASAKAPFLDTARLLLARELDPGARYVKRRSPDGPDALVSTIGAAAKLIVAEAGGSGRPRFAPYRDLTYLRRQNGEAP